jgi:hypothetical protein
MPLYSVDDEVINLQEEVNNISSFVVQVYQPYP